MNTKLTLRLDDSLIDAAKHYAAREGRSVSELVAAYFARLDASATKLAEKASNSNRKSSFYGLLASGKTSAKPKQTRQKLDESAYSAHLVQKHQ